MHGIHSLMREWGCGHRNMEVPRFILRTGGAARDPRLNPSDREVIVDIGLGNDAKETGSAVLNGFVVIAFEPMPENMRSIRRALGKLSTANSKRVDFIDMQRGADGRWTMPPLAKPQAGHGHAYVIRAAVGDTDSTLMLPNANTGGVTGSVTGSNNNSAASSSLVPTPQVKLDTVLRQLPWVTHVRMLKMDTQGYELKVLHGAMESLQGAVYVCSVRTLAMADDAWWARRPIDAAAAAAKARCHLLRYDGRSQFVPATRGPFRELPRATEQRQSLAQGAFWSGHHTDKRPF